MFYNLIYTEGWRTGLTVKCYRFFIFGRTFRVVLFPISYNRAEGITVREYTEQLRKVLDERK